MKMQFIFIAIIFSLIMALCSLGMAFIVTNLLDRHYNEKNKEIAKYCHEQKEKSFQECFDELFLNWRG